MAKAEWIAVDWGTSNLRAWAFDADGRLAGKATSDEGMGKLDPDQFEPALLRLVSQFLDDDTATPIICCGMVGARQGWIEAPYVPVPFSPTEIAGAVRAPTNDPRLEVFILPGAMQSTPPDVMRGEETQIAGYVAANPKFAGTLCLPGTHTKWAEIADGRILGFRTFMTGELFALLSGQSVLRFSLAGEGWDDAAFVEAAENAFSLPQEIAASLFGLRAASLIEDAGPAVARARLSGLLIGLELAGTRDYWQDREVAIIGDTGLAERYATLLAQRGVDAERVDADAMTLAGLSAARRSLREMDA